MTERKEVHWPITIALLAIWAGLVFFGVWLNKPLPIQLPPVVVDEVAPQGTLRPTPHWGKWPVVVRAVAIRPTEAAKAAPPQEEVTPVLSYAPPEPNKNPLATLPSQGERKVLRAKKKVSVRINRRHWWCLARLAYGEARGEPLEGQKAVAYVAVARAQEDRSYWGGSDLCKVVFHKKGARRQFDGARVRARQGAAWLRAVEVARQVLLRPEPPAGVEPCARYFRNPQASGVTGESWHKKNTTPAGIIGKHTFGCDERTLAQHS